MYTPSVMHGLLLPHCGWSRIFAMRFDSLTSTDYQMYALRHIRPLLTLDAAKMITHSVVSLRLHCFTARLPPT